MTMSTCAVGFLPSGNFEGARDTDLQTDTPAELRTHFDKLGWTRVVAFQTR